MDMHEATPEALAEDEFLAPQAEPAMPPLPEMLIAGAVASAEEAASVQQIAVISRWLRLFTEAVVGRPGTEP